MKDSALPFVANREVPVRMCAWTRRIWHNGQWLSVGAFLHERFGLEVSHGNSEDARDRFVKGRVTLDRPTLTG